MGLDGLTSVASARPGSTTYSVILPDVQSPAELNPDKQPSHGLGMLLANSSSSEFYFVGIGKSIQAMIFQIYQMLPEGLEPPTPGSEDLRSIP
jgi:hypothetical protein